ncbi:hypothetical protein EDD27_3618 [Nonomuraea polychroma]|uniref:Uncharacterized protein n=1 Tax=Nonomuraea polychroma TaxID=46176 RepID=A0A438M6A0_9ACTN|nr:hypothetical protein [Nonomuraea polychroma]RVX41148.1 hypothetical protein EDD27_3618 [Nonomuraea polychroma]
MTPAEETPTLVTELKALLPRLQELLPEPVADPTKGTMSHHKISGSPAPWHPEAGGVLMTIRAGVRELEDDLRYHVTGHTGEGRGGSDGNTVAALDTIVRLVHGVDDEMARDACHRLNRWIEQARQIRDIGESEKWIPIRVSKGLPPACPYCNTYSIRLAQQSGRVVCVNVRCEDGNAERPRGRIDKNRLDGSAMLVWADGRSTYYYRGDMTHRDVDTPWKSRHACSKICPITCELYRSNRTGGGACDLPRGLFRTYHAYPIYDFIVVPHLFEIVIDGSHLEGLAIVVYCLLDCVAVCPSGEL